MSDETYYTVLNVKETASISEIKSAYRDLIKQVHPDTIANLAPYLRRMAEDKAKEINEAYTVLSNSSKRRDYDRQLAQYRHQNAPQAPPPPTTPPPAQQPTSQSSSGPYCNRCGTSLHVSGFCPRCNKFTAPVATHPQPQGVRRLGYNWVPLMRWSREHPILTLAIPVFLVWAIVTAISSNDTSQSDLNCPPSQRVEINGRFVCQQVPAQPTQTPAARNAASPATAGFTVVAPSKPTVSVSGTYLGTVYNKTVKLNSTFTTVMHQTKSGALEGCMEVKPPLYGSGVVHGSVRGSRATFSVADITFQGEVSKNAITGSYVVSRQDGQQLGDFRLTKQPGMESYGCAEGALVEVEAPKPQPVAKARSAIYAVVNARSDSALYKRCAFLPLDNYGRCNWGPEEVAELKPGDRVRVLSPVTRAQSGDDIYNVRTQQGWEGWIKAESITLEPQ